MRTTVSDSKVLDRNFVPVHIQHITMFSRALRRAAIEARVATTPASLPPTFLLASSARFFTTTEQQVEAPVAKNAPRAPPAAPVSFSPIGTNPDGSKAPISESVKELLPLLNAQPSKYISALIHGRPYLLTVGDSVRLPFHMPGVSPGDILRLNRASAIGSRDYTLKGAPHVDERIFECRAIVMGTEGEPARIKIKKKQRTRRSKTVISKHKFTILKLAELRVKDLEEIEA